ncbi:cache domain-containing sensor histidine kinase [Paenibacillus radicis (ex Xue et al. 2023)]|uniref:Sensor histidine kinase n=1 Tax=Paenibacillus radicis (ex Xue et al. 2023) TaxID=2972489 RepID=A0ABT1YQK5_9BACL|nr:sensor histidine kinase [Paenibacillus radicis (ex Xue et al. 2023)]MCR8635453.1 sensor histidine kinase [Paenibacillus radicis (ex Xue et al. 2023)]
MLLANLNRLFLSLRMKFMILFMALITIPFIISGAFTYTKYSANVEQNTKNYTLQIVDQIRINLDRYVKEIERLTLSPLYDPNVLAILKNHSSSYQKGVYLTAEEQFKTNLFISSMAFDRSEIESILIFTNDGSLFSNSDTSVTNYWEQETNNWMEKADLEDGGLTINPPHSVSYYTTGPKTVVSLSRLIREPYTHSKIGFIKVDLKAEGFEKIFSSVNLGNNSKLYIYDKDKTLLHPQSTITEPDVNDPRFLSAWTKSKYTGLQILGQIPLGELRKEAKEITSYTLMISLTSLAVALILAILSSDRLVKPIRHLQSKMELVKKGFFKERAIVATNDEIGQLTEVFNRMVGEIDRLVREVYETKLRERDAEISALQSQMNPHFLYNTLESINMMAVQHNHLALSNVVTNLGKLLRYTVDKNQSAVYLRDEVRFVESYLQIQALRCGDSLRMEIFIDPSLQYVLVLKLILQPLVENVIEHGMGSDPVTIRIRAATENDDLILSVEDDGLGIDVQTMEQVLRRIDYAGEEHPVKQEFGQKSSGYALRNVHQRIRLLYGEPYGILLKKNAHKGMTVFIRLPFQWEE